MVEGIFCSYCLSLYGGCDQQDIDALQIMQNKSARIGQSRTSRRQMFSKVNWMTVRQMIFYHRAIAIYRIRKEKEPEYLNGILSRENNRGNVIVHNIP